MQFIPIVERHAKTQSVADFSVPSEGYGQFLVDVFHEWYAHDVGKIYVSQFDNLLGNGSVILPQLAFINPLADNRLSQKPMAMCMLATILCIPNTRSAI